MMTTITKTPRPNRVNTPRLTKEEKNHLTHFYWDRHRNLCGQADQWNSENRISEDDLFTMTRVWVQEVKVFRLREPEEPWAPPAKDGDALRKRIHTWENVSWAAIQPDLELRVKMYEAEGRLRRKYEPGSPFNWIVQVVHMDGTSLVFHNACARTWKGKLFVWTEHCGSHYFYLDDLYSYWMSEHVTIPMAR
jgi:hypothetical protein